MPLYDFQCQCEGCGETFEALVKPNEQPPCPACGSTLVQKLVSRGVSFELRGAGWARDGYHDVVPRRSI